MNPTRKITPAVIEKIKRHTEWYIYTTEENTITEVGKFMLQATRRTSEALAGAAEYHRVSTLLRKPGVIQIDSLYAKEALNDATHNLCVAASQLNSALTLMSNDIGEEETWAEVEEIANKMSTTEPLYLTADLNSVVSGISTPLIENWEQDAIINKIDEQLIKRVGDAFVYCMAVWLLLDELLWQMDDETETDDET